MNYKIISSSGEFECVNGGDMREAVEWMSRFGAEKITIMIVE